LILGALVLIRPIIYFSLFTLFRLRARTAWLAGLGLCTYSEFGLIVASAAVASGHMSNEWLVTLALAIAVSFFISTPLNSAAHTLYRRHAARFQSYQRGDRLPEEEMESLGDATIVVLGMGRVGRGIYNHLMDEDAGKVIGVEENLTRVNKLRAAGYRCIHGDASDRDFWERSNLADRDLIFSSLSNHRENVSVVKLARLLGYTNTLAVSSYFEDDKLQLESMGCVAFNIYANVGTGFAKHVLSGLKSK